MHVYEVGKPYIAGRRRWPERAEYNWRGAHELRLFLARPSETDVEAVTRGPADFALAVHGPVIFLLYRFGPSIPWSDAPYTVHLVPPDMRSAPPDVPAGEGALLHVVLVDAETGLVRGLRALSLAPGFTRQLHAAIAVQLSRPFDEEAYDRALDAVYQRYPTSELLLQTSQATCSFPGHSGTRDGDGDRDGAGADRGQDDV